MLDTVEFDRILRKVGFVESISEWCNRSSPLYTYLTEERDLGGIAARSARMEQVRLASVAPWSEALPGCTVIITDAAGNVLTLPEKC